MYSLGEQTAMIAAQISVGEQRFNVFVTHLGNGGPLVQQAEILARVQGQSNVILMGDFNFRPDSEQYRLTTVDLEDAWVVQAASAENRPDFDPQRRIDHIFVSPDAHVAEARYLISRNSDHPALWADISW
jgi:endonuclease/exonuclease/phosphatase family metal-dependent hydrolase